MNNPYYTSIIISSKTPSRTWTIQDIKMFKDIEEIVTMRIEELFDILTGSTEIEIKFT